ncbi:MAG: hypothetical protein GX054_09600 [Clostridiales bacterium]|nr:hypothetical protein [Clostridiales bacterium]
MTSDYNIIKGKTGYIPGDLYVSLNGKNDLIERISFSQEENVIFDENSYNFHLYPMDARRMKEISEEVKEKRKGIIEVLEKHPEVIIKSRSRSTQDRVKDIGEAFLMFIKGTCEEGFCSKCSIFH